MKATIKRGETKYFTSKRGTNYIIHNVGGDLEVYREYNERVTGGWRRKQAICNITKEIAENFIAE